jgi:hypothetical protein
VVDGRRSFEPRRRVLAAALVLAACLAAAPAGAGELIRLYGGENTGTAGAQFLRVPVGARAVALGKAYSSLATDGSAAFWNPAGIMRTPGRKNFFASHTKYTADIEMNHFSLHTRRQNFGFALSAGILRSGDILRTTEFHQDGTGQYFDANQFFLGASLARAMTDHFSIGGTLKYYQENLDQWQIKSLMFDMGILYFVGAGDVWIGFTVRNFGGDLKPGGTPPTFSDGYSHSPDFQKFPAPTEGAFGASKIWRLSRRLGLLTTADFNHPSDNIESFRLGGELDVNQMLFLRAGYETGRPENGLSAGFGVQLKRKQFLIRVDYAYADMGSFGTVHYLSVDLSPLHRKKSVDPFGRRVR